MDPTIVWVVKFILGYVASIFALMKWPRWKLLRVLFLLIFNYQVIGWNLFLVSGIVKDRESWLWLFPSRGGTLPGSVHILLMNDGPLLEINNPIYSGIALSRWLGFVGGILMGVALVKIVVEGIVAFRKKR